jgi:hypothetical protein
MSHKVYSLVGGVTATHKKSIPWSNMFSHVWASELKKTNKQRAASRVGYIMVYPLCHGPEPILNSIFQYLKPPSWAHHKTKSGPAWQHQDIEGLW